MFEVFLNYKKRLSKIRRELIELELQQERIQIAAATQEDLKPIAGGIAKLCSILVRVIDSLPGG